MSKAEQYCGQTNSFKYFIETAHQKEKSQGGKFLTGLRSGLGDHQGFYYEAIKWPYCVAPEKGINREQQGYVYGAVGGGGGCSNREEHSIPT